MQGPLPQLLEYMRRKAAPSGVSREMQPRRAATSTPPADEEALM
jgi:hypothetical protein